MKSHPLRAWCMVCHAWQPLDHTSEDCAQAVMDTYYKEGCCE